MGEEFRRSKEWQALYAVLRRENKGLLNGLRCTIARRRRCPLRAPRLGDALVLSEVSTNVSPLLRTLVGRLRALSGFLGCSPIVTGHSFTLLAPNFEGSEVEGPFVTCLSLKTKPQSRLSKAGCYS